ncbi:hypothetical protein [Acidithiobacillus sp.]|uniref:hypothetical protein n=1 Tax=Acidithiobacillus sp. TaxID=1872118 RepID=UPI0025828F08|nr:hypothetical protein [Acidithiobacillus sp.]MDD5374445.1 hypothetical protein [Acidithiobacillus sp.]
MDELYMSDNAAFLDAMGYDPLDAGEDIGSKHWSPSVAEYQSYKKRDLELARGNIAILALSAEPRRQVTIDNGIPPSYEELTEAQAKRYRRQDRGYGSIGVIVGGPEAEDCLHSLATFGEAKRKGAAQANVLRTVVALAGRAKARLRAA